MKTWEKYLMFALLFAITSKHCSETTLGEISALISSVISLAYSIAATIAVFRQNPELRGGARQSDVVKQEEETNA